MRMSRRILLATVSVLALAQPAWADVPVIDFAAVEQAISQVEWLGDQYTEMTKQLDAVTDVLDTASMATGLLDQAVQNPMSLLNGQLASVVGGAVLSQIPEAQAYVKLDQVYHPPGLDFNASSLNGAANSLANLKGIAERLMNTNQTRLGELHNILTSLSSVLDITQVSRLNGRIAVENQTMLAQQAQIAQLQQMASLQEMVRQQQLQQKMRSDDDAQINDTATGTVGNVALPVPPTPPTFIGN